MNRRTLYITLSLLMIVCLTLTAFLFNKKFVTSDKAQLKIPEFATPLKLKEQKYPQTFDQLLHAEILPRCRDIVVKDAKILSIKHDKNVLTIRYLMLIPSTIPEFAIPLKLKEQKFPQTFDQLYAELSPKYRDIVIKDAKVLGIKYDKNILTIRYLMLIPSTIPVGPRMTLIVAANNDNKLRYVLVQHPAPISKEVVANLAGGEIYFEDKVEKTVAAAMKTIKKGDIVKIVYAYPK